MDNIIDRIRKLLALAKDKGASEAEAAAAMAKASDLMIRYNIDKIEDKEDGPSITQGRWTTDCYDQTWEAYVIGAVAVLYDCKAASDKHGRYWHFYGRPQNVAACEETLPYVLDQVQAQYKIALKAMGGRMSKSERGEFRQTFKEACARKVFYMANEIKAAQKNQIPDHKALVVINNIEEEITAFELQGNYKEGRDVKLRKSGTGSGAGFVAGGNIQLQGRMNK